MAVEAEVEAEGMMLLAVQALLPSQLAAGEEVLESLQLFHN
jgi:hypothetical protein